MTIHKVLYVREINDIMWEMKSLKRTYPYWEAVKIWQSTELLVETKNEWEYWQIYDLVWELLESWNMEADMDFRICPHAKYAVKKTE